MNQEFAMIHMTRQIIPVILDSSPEIVDSFFQQESSNILASLDLADRYNGGGWDVVSHDYLVLANHVLVVSFLLRRPKTS